MRTELRHQCLPSLPLPRSVCPGLFGAARVGDYSFFDKRRAPHAAIAGFRASRPPQRNYWPMKREHHVDPYMSLVKAKGMLTRVADGLTDTDAATSDWT